MSTRPPLWEPGRYALLWLTVGLILWACLFCVSEAFGQEVRGYTGVDADGDTHHFACFASTERCSYGIVNPAGEARWALARW